LLPLLFGRAARQAKLCHTLAAGLVEDMNVAFHQDRKAVERGLPAHHKIGMVHKLIAATTR